MKEEKNKNKQFLIPIILLLFIVVLLVTLSTQSTKTKQFSSSSLQKNDPITYGTITLTKENDIGRYNIKASADTVLEKTFWDNIPDEIKSDIKSLAIENKDQDEGINGAITGIGVNVFSSL